MEPADRAQLLDSAGFLARYHGDFAAAEATINEGLTIARQFGDQHAIADSLANVGFVYLQQDALDRAREVYTEALAIYHQLANEQGTADSTIHLGLIAFYEGDTALAQEYYQESLAIWQRLGDRQGVVYAQHKLGDVAFQQGDYETATKLHREALQGAHEISFQLIIATSLEGLALIAAAQQEPQRALQLASAATQLRQQANVPTSTARQRFIDQALASAYESLGPESIQAAWHSGQELALDKAVALASN